MKSSPMTPYGLHVANLMGGLPGAEQHASTTCKTSTFHEVLLTLTPSRTSVRTADLIESGSEGQALIRLWRSPSTDSHNAPTAPDSAPPVSETAIFPEEFTPSSSPCRGAFGFSTNPPLPELTPTARPSGSGLSLLWPVARTGYDDGPCRPEVSGSAESRWGAEGTMKVSNAARRTAAKLSNSRVNRTLEFNNPVPFEARTGSPLPRTRQRHARVPVPDRTAVIAALATG